MIAETLEPTNRETTTEAPLIPAGSVTEQG